MKLSAFIAGLALFASAGAFAAQPNFLFIFADDMAFDTIASHGYPEVETPQLDRLTRSGVHFTHAYNMGGYHGAVCVASRTMLNTGRFLWNAQQAEKELKQWQADGKMWSQLLGKAGYDTYFTGKWHVRADTKTIFSTARNVRGGMPSQTKQGYNRPIDGQPDPWDPADPKFGGFWQGGTHWSEVVGDDGVDFLKAAGKKDKPFFMYLAFNAPHDPRQAPQEYLDKYPADKIKLPVPFMSEYPHQMGSNKIRDEKLAPFPRTENSVKVNRREYFALITHMDTQIGRILDQLEASGKKDNTYIFFSADHGLGCGHHGLMGKQNMYDHSIRVPFVIAGPDIPKSQTNSTPIYFQDIMPTTLELAGVSKPDYVQFHSILPLVKGEKKQQYEAIYTAYTGTQRSVTEDGWKLIIYPQIGVQKLFNLQDDPWETKDLAGKAGQASRIADLRNTLKRLAPDTGDTLDIDASPKKGRKK